MPPIVVINVVGLTPRLLAHMPGVSKVGAAAALRPILPAVTCSMQATLLTGAPPRRHGIVGNGWYFRDLGEVFLWRQHNALIQGGQLWDSVPGLRTANVCWWYAMGAAADLLVTPRPIYHADGRKSPDCYTRPPSLHDELPPFPLFSYWGPGAGIASTEWIVGASVHILRAHRPDLMLVYIPHLDYDLQRYGPDGPQAVAAAQAVETALAPLLAEDATFVVLSEYGITPASRPVDVNRALRAAGLLEVYTQAGMEYLDPWTSRAFAVADHQLAHVYVRDPADLPRVRSVVSELPGVDEVLDETGKAVHGLDHERSGELVAVAEPDAWFTYYYWLDDARAPDFARLVEIHRKPGYDPAELFMDPADPFVKVRAGLALARKRLGLRYTMPVVPLDPSPVRGSHGRLPDSADDGPVLLGPFDGDAYPATAVKGLLEGLISRRAG
ncbi:nucleotide pyrophosphatase/phosphodiesterase family protein [Nonomuraea sp. NPDC003804]|uniref:alkaline phosphatase family protein n=1 Tax=Nonomuraea sp. NPDC003804 TaxID=3154547 RepID=UPI0033A40D7D